MFFLFPVYQLIAFISMAAIVFSFEAASTGFQFIVLGVVLAIVLGVPIIASWHLSCLLFGIGYFGFFAWLGMPVMPWVVKQLEEAVAWFRPVQ